MTSTGTNVSGPYRGPSRHHSLSVIIAVLFAAVVVVVHGQDDKTTKVRNRTSHSHIHDTYCHLHVVDERIFDTLSLLEKGRAKLIEYDFTINNRSAGRQVDDIGNYQPFFWMKAVSRHGVTLLMLSFHYNVLSLSMLTIGVEKLNVGLVDSPPGCFKNLDEQGKVDIFRNLVLNDLRQEPKPPQLTLQVQYACNQFIADDSGYGNFVYRCCRRLYNGNVICEDTAKDIWISLLYVCIMFVKLGFLMYSPMLVPQSLYKEGFVAAEYVVKLKEKLKMKLYISEKRDIPVSFKHKVTVTDITEWRRFLDTMETLPKDEILDLFVPELRLKIKNKKIIPEDDVPTGLLYSLYLQIFKCKIRHVGPFVDCCSKSTFGPLKHRCSHEVKWVTTCKLFVKLLAFFLLPLPFYIRVLIYYNYETEEIFSRRSAMSHLGLTEKFTLYQGTILQYLSPTHPVFICMYSFYILAAVLIGSTGSSLRKKFKAIAQDAFRDMANVSQLETLGMIVGIIIWPFRRLGVFGLLIAPVYWIVGIPLAVVGFFLYCLPTVYLTFRLVMESREEIVKDDAQTESEEISRSRLRKRLKNLKKPKFAQKKKRTHNSIASQLAMAKSRTRMSRWKELIAQFLMSLFCLCILYTMTVMIMECAGLLVEMIVFTLMGIIVNAGTTLRYVALIFMVILYMNDCYNNVYDNYLKFNQTVIGDIIKRVDDLQKVACLSSDEQENMAFQVKTVEEDYQIKTRLNTRKKKLRFDVGQLLLFFDSHDTPRIPKRLFQRLCQIQISGCPGPVYLNLLHATGRFLVIVLFLFFVSIVVMAFGEVYRVSSTNQMAATLAGGLLPWLFRSVISKVKGKSLNLNSVSFKGQVDEIINGYKQSWPLIDLVVSQEDPFEEEKKDDDDKSKDGDSGKEGDEKKEDDKKDDDTKTDDKEKNDVDDKKDSSKEKKKDDEKEKDTNEKESENDDLSHIETLSHVSSFAVSIDEEEEEDETEVDLFVDLSGFRWTAANALGSMTMINTDEPYSAHDGNGFPNNHAHIMRTDSVEMMETTMLQPKT